ncbi:glycosyltransferase [Paenibacillus sp. SI8]|uniref:glycosyltransferase n=1 Tax=unclassified Paenibacillus TaxID=185978 RepID=UPI003465D49D
MRKVVHLTTVHHPLDTRIYHKECSSLARNGFDVTLIAPYNEDLDNLAKAPFHLITQKKSSNRWLRMTRDVWRVYRIAKEMRADVYHFHDPELLLIGVLLKKKHNHVVYDVHEDYETGIMQKKYLPRFVRLIASKIFRAVEMACAKRFEICLAEKYYKEKFPNGALVLNYPIIDPVEKHSPNPEDHSMTVDEQIHLLYTGNVTEDRGALIHAQLADLPNVHMHYVGKCSKNVADNILLAAGEGSKRVHMRGVESFVNREEIDHTYKQGHWHAGIALFPPTEHYMKKELTKFFEYMNAGLPLLCSNFPSWKEFVDKHKCGITVDPYDKEAVSKAIMYLKNNPEEAAQMAQNGRKAVMELSWTSQEQILVDFYNGMRLV